MKNKLYILLILFIGCKTQPIIKNYKPSIKAGCELRKKEGARNFVLHSLEIGIDCFQLERYAESAEYLDDAISAIETIIGTKKNVDETLSVFNSEDVKIFKGEPYERAIAYYYRGLLYAMKKDYENARACFRSGLFQDLFAENKKYSSDFASFIYLDLWCTKKIGDNSLLEQNEKMLIKLRPKMALPNKNDLLLIIETGNSPRKLRDGVKHSKLVFRRGKKNIVDKVDISYSNNKINAPLMEDIFYQSSTRGGRMIDSILQGKVLFQNKMEGVGKGLSDFGNSVSILSDFNNSSDMNNAGYGLALIGAINLFIAANGDATADNRYCRNIPDKLFFKQINPETKKIKISYFNESKEIYQEEKKILNQELLIVRYKQQLFSGVTR